MLVNIQGTYHVDLQFFLYTADVGYREVGAYVHSLDKRLLDTNVLTPPIWQPLHALLNCFLECLTPVLPNGHRSHFILIKFREIRVSDSFAPFEC